jgi:hypothetical protein
MTDIDDVQLHHLAEAIAAISKNSIVDDAWSIRLRNQLSVGERSLKSARGAVAAADAEVKRRTDAHNALVAQNAELDRRARLAEEERRARVREEEDASAAKLVPAKDALQGAAKALTAAHDAVNALDTDVTTIIEAHDMAKQQALSPEERQKLFERIAVA